jgi:DNA-binding transcriptional LysR family regulator
MARDIDISLLRAFLAVVETGSVTGAARLLNRTQAAVSLQIKRLEEQLACDLFERERNRLTLAPHGERLLGAAKELVGLNDVMWGAMTTPVFEGKVRLGVPVDIVASYIPPILRRFNQAWPRVQVSLSCRNSHELLQDLEAGVVDLTLTTDRPEQPSRGETLRLDRLVWVGAPGGKAYRARPLPLTIGSMTCRFRPAVLAALRKAGQDWRMVMEVKSQEAIYAVVSADVAVTAQLADSVQSGLAILGAEAGLPELPQFGIQLVMPSAGGTEIASELARHIRQEFAARFGYIRIAA